MTSQVAPASTPTARPHSILDRGAAAVLLMVLGLFVAPEEAWVTWGPPLANPASTEAHILVYGALLALALPALQIALHIRLVGGDLVRGNRDGLPALTGMVGRVRRAHANLVESLVPFAGVVLVARAEGVSNRATVAAAGMYLAARVVHATTYTFGVTVIRSAGFYAGLIATVQIALAALTRG